MKIEYFILNTCFECKAIIDLIRLCVSVIFLQLKVYFLYKIKKEHKSSVGCRYFLFIACDMDDYMYNQDLL